MKIIITFLFIFTLLTQSKTIKQFNSAQTQTEQEKQKELKETIKSTTKLLKEDGFLTNEMDLLIVKESKPWNGKKAPLFEMDQIRYPKKNHPNDFQFTTKEKQQIIDENKNFMNKLLQYAAEGTLGRMPEDLGGDEQFEADEVDYNADRVTIEYVIQPKLSSWRPIGWAFPGEIVILEFPEGMDLSQIGIAIGKTNKVSEHSHLGTGNWANVRMPIDTIEFGFDTFKDYLVDNTIKIGSPLGGMVYVKTSDNMINQQPFSVICKNVGIAPIFIIGQTTQQEWEETLKNSPGNVMEMRLPGIRFVAVKSRIPENFDVEYAMKYWYEAHSNADQVVGIPNMPIVMYYDQRVDAGAAVAFVGAHFTQHPSDWATGALDKEGLINSGNWGSLHEFNHHKQNVNGMEWGIDPSGESTNNALNTVQYIEYTNIAGQRHNELTNWNWVTDGYETMKKVVGKTNTDQKALQMYVTTMHAFGTQKLLNIMKRYDVQRNEFGETGTKFPGVNIKSGEAYCYFAAQEIQRDTRYICSLFEFDMSQAVSDAIAAMNYPTYYPIYNKYCMYYEGNRYGRAYKIYYKVPFIIDLPSTTAIDPKAQNVQYTFTRQPTGSLKQTSTNVYEYIPSVNPGETTSFEIEVKCTINNKQVVVKLQGEFEIMGNICEVKEYRECQCTNIDTCLEEIKNKEPTHKFGSSVAGLYNYDYGAVKSFAIAEGNIIIDKEGWYTLFMRADDYCRAFIEVDGIQTIAEITHDQQNYLATNENSFKTLHLEQGIYRYKIYNYNGGGLGHAQMGYCYHGTEESSVDVTRCTIQDIPQSMIVHKDITQKVEPREFDIPEIKYWRKGRHLSHGYRSIPVCETLNDETCKIKCNQLPPKHNDGASSCANMFDNDKSTMYHSQWHQNTPFPATYEFVFEEPVSFNSLYMHYRYVRDSWGTFTMYGSLGETENYQQFYQTTNTPVIEKTFFMDKMYKFDKIKVIVDNNSQNNNFVNVVEFTPQVATNPFANYSKPFDDNIQRQSGFEKVVQIGAYGNYVIQNTKAGEGELCFNFQGKRFGLYGHRTETSGKGKVKFDSGEEQFDESYVTTQSGTLFYYHDFDTDKIHNVCIEVTEGIINIDVVGFE